MYDTFYELKLNIGSAYIYTSATAITAKLNNFTKEDLMDSNSVRITLSQEKEARTR